MLQNPHKMARVSRLLHMRVEAEHRKASKGLEPINRAHKPLIRVLISSGYALRNKIYAIRRSLKTRSSINHYAMLSYTTPCVGKTSIFPLNFNQS